MRYALLLCFVLLPVMGTAAESGYVITTIADGATGLNQVAQEARAHLAILDQHIGKPDTSCSILVMSKSGEAFVNLWLESVKKDGDVYVATVGTLPEQAVGLHQGQIIRIQPAQVTDWSVSDGRGPVLGMYVLRSNFSQLTPGEVAKAKRAMRWE